MKEKVDYEEISEVLKAVAHPVRLQILAGLLEDECNVGKIQDTLGLPQSTVSQHLAILRRHKIVKARREGVKVCYRVESPLVKKIIKLLAQENK